ncbi:phosphoribosyltransferase-like protein [Noviherbaspirillum pedocola]|uniref:PRTase-CE domain-containing protein n=1 Tax=Noviherbaspirillum pedocola TaxID=2801341 RepID=A0A934SXX3_9BURK|nr:hypothetical protein [Noviherbaspirillum pedocola]MBK4737360.1 hypothetical protein [Noviherbaspirillum pedocola]
MKTLLANPDNQQFIEQVHQRTRNYVKSGIWASISLDRLDRWIDQFDYYQYPFLGAVLLDNLLFKSKAQVLATLEWLMTCPDLCYTFASDLALTKSLSKKQDPGVRLVPAISFDKPPTKSGFYVLRLIQRLFRIYADWLIWPQKVIDWSPGARLLIIVDDFLGSGDQFKDFVSITKLETFHKDHPEVRIVYLVLAAHADGISAIQHNYPFVDVICADTLGKEYHLFDGARVDERYQRAVSAELKKHYLDLAKKASLPLTGKVGPFGYGGQCLSYAFEHATPNNALPAYWYDTNNWEPLLDR